jgi:YebC/PmpR family DNA-binding regulatory protein
MSGHSKWANIKRQKNAQDQKRGKVFSQLSRLISTAVKEGGSSDPDFNPQLRQAVERAKEEDMPKEKIKRAINTASDKKINQKEFTLEGYGPAGVAVLVKLATDNYQRSVQEIKNIFERNNGSLAEPGAVAYQFSQRGFLEIVDPNNEEKMLQLIDLNPDDIQSEEGIIILWAEPNQLARFKKKTTELGLKIQKSGIVLKAKAEIEVGDEVKAGKVLQFLGELGGHEDIQKVFSNLADINE